MNEAALAGLSIVIFGWAILSDWFTRHNLTGPLMFMVAGLVLANSSWGIGSVNIEGSTVHHLAEITLALLLFGDASGVPPAAARHDLSLTSRLLAIGLPLSILAGTAMAVLVYPSLPLALAGLIAASLAPTDAALSESVIADERLPVRVRRVLNVESGLNDGIATPVVTFCIAAAATALGVIGHDYDDGFGALGQLLDRRRCRRRGSARRRPAPLPRPPARLDAVRYPTVGHPGPGTDGLPRRIRGRRQPVRVRLRRRIGLRVVGPRRRGRVDRAHRAGRQPAVARRCGSSSAPGS